jgi:hypothetical protein
MISDFDANFLSIVLEEVGRGEPITRYEFFDEEIDDFKSRCESNSSGSSNVRRFFQSAEYEVCRNCNSESDRCSCSKSELERVFEVSPEAIVEDWCENLESLSYYDEVFIEDSGPVREVKAVSKEFNILTFWMVTDSSCFVDLDPSISSKEFVVSLIESPEVGERDHYFMWYSLLDESAHEELHSRMRDLFALPSERICDTSSEATSENVNAIKSNIHTYLDQHGFGSVDAQREARGAGQVLDFSEVDFAVQRANDVVVTCSCNKSSSDVHLHYIVDGEIHPVSESEEAITAAERMREKIARVETLRQNTYELGGRMRAAVIAVGAVTLAPFISSLTEVIDVFGLNLEGYPVSWNFLFTGLLLLLFFGLLLPSARLTVFSWDIRDWKDRILDRLTF